MNSSTFNFKKASALLICVIFALAIVEAGLRIFEEHLSVDIHHIHEISRISKKLVNSNGYRILFLGNSLTRRGIDKQTILEKFRQYRKVDVAIERVYPDDTSIVEWYYILERYVLRDRKVPDLIVISFALEHLCDTEIGARNICRIASYSPLDEFGQVISFNRLDFGNSLDLFLCKFSKLFSDRRRIEMRVLDHLPYYRLVRDSIYEGMLKSQKPQELGHHESYRFLESVVAESHKRGVDLAFVAMPLPRVYPLDPAMIRIIRSAGAQLIDARALPGINDSHFSDAYHLNPEGAKLTSAFVATKIIPKLPGTFRKDPIPGQAGKGAIRKSS